MKIDDQTISEIADESHSHPRSVERRLLRLPVRGRVEQRIDAALQRRGLRLVTETGNLAAPPDSAA